MHMISQCEGYQMGQSSGVLLKEAHVSAFWKCPLIEVAQTAIY